MGLVSLLAVSPGDVVSYQMRSPEALVGDLSMNDNAATLVRLLNQFSVELAEMGVTGEIEIINPRLFWLAREAAEANNPRGWWQEPTDYVRIFLVAGNTITIRSK
jgi:hypothetical protein